MTNPSRRDDGAPVADIYRLYCTHCTFGTSVLEKRTTENAARVLGYSVRAASIRDREKIQRVFRAIERLLSYDLPKGTPPTDKLTYDAAKAPRRLVFMPRLNDHQVVGLMSYRSQDTAGRPGSYFGDFLVARTGATPSGDWSAVDCLRLWPATHTGEIVNQWWCDSEERVAADEAAEVSPIAPETLSSVGGPGIISDETFISFLSTKVGTSFEDPGQVIPPRWAEIHEDDRQLLFARLAQATVDVLKSRKGTVTLVVEPSLAALLFYGVCRILPQRLLAADGNFPGLSFSTYDPSPDRATTTLVATVCSGQGVDGDLPGEAYKRGFVCNTFVPGLRYGVVSEPGNYVARVAEHLQRESRIPDEVIGEYNALSDLNITEIDALPALTDDLVRYLYGTDRLDKYPQLTAKAAGTLTSAGKSLRAALVRKRLESLAQPYPPDLLEVVVDWLGNELAGDWKVKGPLYKALQPILPTSERELDKLIQRAGTKLSQDIRDSAVITVTLATGWLPKALAVMAVSDRSSLKLGDALRRTIERVKAKADRVEDILSETIERHADSFLPIFARHFDTLASVGGIQDRLPLAELLLKKAFPCETLQPFEKWAILESCSRSKITHVPGDVWNDGIWCADRLEECFRGVRTRMDLEKRAFAAKEWTKRHDAAKVPETQLEPLVDPWMKLLVAVDALRDAKEKSKEQRRESGLAIVTAATFLVQDQTSTWQPSESEIRKILTRAVKLRCESDAEKQWVAELIDGVQQESQSRRLRDICVARRRNNRRNWILFAKGLAARLAVPLAILITVLALVAALAVLLHYLSMPQPGETPEAKEAIIPKKAAASKAKPRRAAEAPPTTMKPNRARVEMAYKGSLNTKTEMELLSSGSSPSISSNASGPHLPVRNALVPGVGAGPSDAGDQVVQANDQVGHAGVISRTSRSIRWVNGNGAFAMPPVQLKFPIS